MTKKKHPYPKIYDLYNTDNIFFTNHARSGLRLVLNALDLPEGSRIGVQAYNCHTVFQSISKAGFMPYFIDVSDNYTLDIEDLEEKAAKIDALIVTHTFGIPVDFDEIKQRIPNIPIIEDCAHSFLSSYKNNLTGTLGDASIFSFGTGKFPSIGNGGYVLINNKSIVSKFLMLYEQLSSNSLIDEVMNVHKNLLISFASNRFIFGLLSRKIGQKLEERINVGDKFSSREAKGLNSNISLFFNKFEFFNMYFEKQRANAKYLINKLKKGFDLIDDSETKKLNFFLLPLRLPKNEPLIRTFLAQGIEIGRHFSHSIQWAMDFGYKKGFCPNSEKIAKEILSIPCHYNYPQNKLMKIATILNEQKQK